MIDDDDDDVPIRGDNQEDAQSHPGEETDRSPRGGGGCGRHPGAAGASRRERSGEREDFQWGDGTDQEQIPRSLPN